MFFSWNDASKIWISSLLIDYLQVKKQHVTLICSVIGSILQSAWRYKTAQSFPLSYELIDERTPTYSIANP